jgi:hypothetical protein
MNILTLANTYIKTTRPSTLKKQRISNIVDAMKLIRHKLDISLRNKKVALNRKRG